MFSKLPRWVWLGGAVLTFAAGMINAIALLGFLKHGATHVTGTFSSLSIALSDGRFSRAVGVLKILGSFFLGALLSGIILNDTHLEMGRRYDWALGMESILLVGSAYAFHHDSNWGEYFACAAAGLQNGLASTYSGAIVRTTHLTGILTDLGVEIGHWMRGAPLDQSRIRLFLILIFGFTLGGIAGAFFYRLWSTYAMLAPAVITGTSSLGYVFYKRYLKKILNIDSI